ncbi:MAG: LAO/AO transport system kinase [Planctomycetota bacterium]|jgi:LAO/AO transport system kinase
MAQSGTPKGPGGPESGRGRASDRAGSLAAGVLAGNRTRLAQAITLIESTRSADAPVAQELLNAVLPETGRAHRVGISGVPGVGKSTLIETLGLHLIEQGHRVAVLAIDPSSTLSGGSILGDKSRMERLAQAEAAFIRPSPSAATLGGVAQRTRETMLLCEAAGFDVILIETVGVGQSEIAVREMVDTFVVLLLPGAGDELQGIKKGILEVGDILAVNKADGSRVNLARAAARDHSAAMRYIRPRHPEWTPKTLVVSAETGAGIDELWTAIGEHQAMLTSSGSLMKQRSEQATHWMWSLIEERLFRAFREDPSVASELDATVEAVREGSLAPGAAASRLLGLFGPG